MEAAERIVCARLKDLLRVDHSTVVELERRISLLEPDECVDIQASAPAGRSSSTSPAVASLSSRETACKVLSALTKSYAGGGFHGLSVGDGFAEALPKLFSAELHPVTASSALRRKDVHIVAHDGDEWIIIWFRLHIALTSRPGKLMALLTSSTNRSCVLEYAVYSLHVHTPVLVDADVAGNASPRCRTSHGLTSA